MNFIDFSLKLNKFPIGKAKVVLEKIQNLDDPKFQEYINNQKEYIVKYHIKNNPFYKDFFGKTKSFNDWNSLPIMTKRDLQLPLKERLSEGFNSKNVYINKTSGSSGTPFYFAKDKFTHALTWSIIQNRFNWYGLYGKKQARFYGEPKEMFAKSKEQLKDILSNRSKFNVFDLSNTAFDKWLSKFAVKKFIYLNGYTTVLVAFANYLISKNIVLNNVCNTLTTCVVTSEMCFESDILVMEKAFGVPVIKEYGASELDLIAFQNKEKQWMVNTESLLVEVLDENNLPLPNGETGKIVITSLYNKAHPFIRYEIGDMGAIKALRSKDIILEKLEGRREDLVYLPNGKVSPGLTFYYITKSIMEDSNNVKEIKVFQTAFDVFEIHYVAEHLLDENQKSTIKEKLSKYLVSNLKVNFFKKNKLKRSESGKLKQFTSLIKS